MLRVLSPLCLCTLLRNSLKDARQKRNNNKKSAFLKGSFFFWKFQNYAVYYVLFRALPYVKEISIDGFVAPYALRNILLTRVSFASSRNSHFTQQESKRYRVLTPKMATSEPFLELVWLFEECKVNNTIHFSRQIRKYN